MIHRVNRHQLANNHAIDTHAPTHTHLTAVSLREVREYTNKRSLARSLKCDALLIALR